MDSSSSAVPSLIGGQEKLASATFSVTDPSTGEVCWEVASVSEQDARQTADIAQAAFPTWAATTSLERQAILFKAADLMEAREDELVRYMRTEMGTDDFAARNIVVRLAIRMMREIASRIHEVMGSVPKRGVDGQSTMVWREPYGVVLGIVPWNAPYVFGVRSAATALATGNTTILKSSEMTPRCYWALGRIFQDAGVPAGAINVICCRRTDAASVTNALIEHPAIKKLNFTGSASVGRQIAAHCSLHLKPILMELGGKNSAIILPDADLAKAAQECLIGAFANSGQICMSTDVLVIHKDIADTFLETLKATMKGLQTQSLPVVVSSEAVSRIAAVIDDATRKGGKIFVGGLPPSRSKTASVLPTVIGGLSDDMLLWDEEAFGPLVGYRLFTDEDEAIQLVNRSGSGYGLSASIFTRDLRKAFAVAKRIEAGQVHINTMTVNGAEGVPFGGVKSSGWGRFGAKEGMDEFLTTKTVTWDD